MSDDRDDGPGFASRWSRVKREARAEPDEAEPAAEVGAAEPEAQALDDRPDEEVLEELGLPDPDTLKPGDDFTAFMARAVPARLRNRALRKLWVSDPVLANLDMLVDYGEDFTDAATVIENLETAYQVGKGFVDKVAEVSGEDAGSAEEPPGEPSGEPAKTGDKKGDEPGEETGADDGSTADPAEEIAPEIMPEETGEKAVPDERNRPRRRMRFRLVEE
ncbi:MAG: DUF3306 domain-containing protein [Paracoccaceae bacterium]